jgi:hypothetical protein
MTIDSTPATDSATRAIRDGIQVLDHHLAQLHNQLQCIADRLGDLADLWERERWSR